MKKTLKRWGALLLAVVMALSLLPPAALAASAGDGASEAIAADDSSRDISTDQYNITVSSQNSDNHATEGPKDYAIDNRLNTFWHSNRATDKADRWIAVELREATWISALRYRPRSDYTKANSSASPTVNGNGYVTSYEVLVSQNGTEWISVASGDWDAFEEVSGRGSLPTGAWEVANFTPVQAKYIKLVGVHTAGNGNTDQYMHAAEIRVAAAQEQPAQTYSVSGTVVNASSAPLSGAVVTIAGQRATTGSGGTYTVNNLADGTYTATVTLDGYELENGAEVTINGGNVTGHTFQMRAVNRAVTGTVTSGGEPLEGAAVTLVQANDTYTTVAGPTTFTGADGSYTLGVNGVPAGSYKVRVSKAGYETAIGSTAVNVVTSSPTGTFTAGGVSINAIVNATYDYNMSDADHTPAYTPGANTAARVQDNGLFMNFNGSSRANNQVRLNGISFQDAVVEFDAARGGTGTGTGFGVMLRRTDDSNYFFVGRNSAGSWYSESVNNGGSSSSAAATGPSFDTGETRHFKVQIHQDGGAARVSLWVDGVSVINNAQAGGNGQGPALGQLAFACGVNNTSVTVKNLYITVEDAAYTIAMPETLTGYVVVSGAQDTALAESAGAGSEPGMRYYAAHAGDVVNIYSADPTQKEMSAPLTVYKTADNSVSSTENILHVPTTTSAHSERGSYIQFRMPAYDVTLNPVLTPVEPDGDGETSVLILRSGDPDIPEIINVGGQATLRAVIVPGITAQEVEWTSSDDTVVTVEGAPRSDPDESGKSAAAVATITGKKAGTAIITITVDGKTATREVTVGKAVANVIFQDHSGFTLYTNGTDAQRTAALTPTVNPADATDKTLKWVSSDETVATVDQNGVVTAAAPGTARITAISQQNTEAYAYRDVTVAALPKTLTLDASHLDLTVAVGDSTHEQVVKATLLPENTSNKTIRWETDNAAVATVTKPWEGLQDAIVTGRAPGRATITARSQADGSVTATLTVTVTQRIVGQAAVSGETKFGSDLTVDINDIAEAAKDDLTYQWFRVKNGTTTAITDDSAGNKTYTPVEADIGSRLTVKVTAHGNYMGETTFTTAVIDKADGPTITGAGASGIHGEPVSAAGDDGRIVGFPSGDGNIYEWKAQNAPESAYETVNGTEVTGLSAGEYNVRIQGTNTHKAGAPIAVTVAPHGVVTHLINIGTMTPANSGTVTRRRGQAAAGEERILTVRPAEGYQLAENGLSVSGDVSGDPIRLTPGDPVTEDGKTYETYTFTMPDESVTVAAAFEKKTYTIGHELEHITCDMVEHNHTATHGDRFTITLTPEEGYEMPRSLTVTETETGERFTDYTYTADPTDPAKRVLTFAHGVTADITVEGEAVFIGYVVSYAPERVRFVTAPSQAGWHQELVVTMTPEVGYRLPDAVTVTMDGSGLTAGADYSYNSTSGVITIHSGVIEGILEIAAQGERIITPLDKVSISGVAQVGQRLTANITPAEADGHVSYQWYWVEGEGDDAVETLIEYATGRTRVLTEASLGKTIVVKATALPGSDFSGTVPSQPTGTVISADETGVMPQWVQIRRDSVSMDVGGTDTLVAYVGPSNATDKTVLWSSSDETVVRVENGVITAVSPGVAVITVTTQADTSVADTCTVRVAETQNVTAEAGDVTVTYDGMAHGISVIVTNPAAGNANITYSSDGVHYSGTNPTFSAAGEHTVWYQAASAGMTAFQGQAKVIILKAAPELSVSADRATLTQAGNVTISITAPDYVDPNGLSLEADDLMIPITRNEDGTYTAQLPAAEKTYTFTVTLRPSDNYDGASASYTVTVKRPVSGGGGVVIQPITTTETRENPDGSVTTTTTNTATGTVTETTRRPDGTRVEKVTASNKDVEFTVTDSEGETMAEVRIPAVMPVPETRFVDVPEGHWADEAIHSMAALEVVNGVGGNRFDMDASMTRGALATVLSRISNGKKGLDNSFDDVAPGQWYTDGVAWAAMTGVVTGYDADTFGPNDAITREQLAVMLCRYARLLGMDTDTDSGVLDGFTDGGLTHDWAAESMSWCVVNGILQGKGDAVLAPTDTATRAETAMMFQRFISLMK